MSRKRNWRRATPRAAIGGAASSKPSLLWGGVVIALVGLGLASLRDPLNLYRTEPTSAAAFVGSASCASCHQAQAAGWTRSQHRAAMAAATAETVLGDFRNATFTYAGTTSVFFTRNQKFYVHTDGPAGGMGDFEIKYTFGVYPLQQYLIQFSDGRLQALSIAWDARPRNEGGQRWFHIYPGERITHKDELHWTRPAQNWNYMCADCHSTAVRKNYDPANDRFDTRWAETSVGCEACHGPGSRHVDWASHQRAGRVTTAADSTRGLTVRLDERRNAHWTINAKSGNAVRSRPRTTQREIEVCAQCHSRRGQLDEGYEAGKPFFDYYRPALLNPPLYHADGQQRDEVYTWGSFLQSRMFARGVTCSDCHDPHTGKLRGQGNGVCAGCHQAAKYNTPAHHRHTQGGAGASCTACHMPPTNYMVIDPRHDHSLRVPRPDLSVISGTPNACNSCHSKRSAGWAAAQVAAYGPRSQTDARARAAAALASSDRSTVAAQAQLRSLALDTAQPRITRATALSELNAAADAPATLRAFKEGLLDRDPAMRLAVLQSVAQLPPEWHVLATPLLSDPARAVRVQAVSLLARAPVEQFSLEQRAAFERAADEFGAAQRFNADRAEGRVNLGTFYGERGNTAQAEAQLSAALHLDSLYVPAYVNLADAYRAQGRDAQAEQILRTGISRIPNSAVLHHSLGLALVRLKRSNEALGELARASALDPRNARFAYVYAVALHSSGKVKTAIARLEAALADHPDDRDILAALVSFHERRGDAARARRYTDQLRTLSNRERK